MQLPSNLDLSQLELVGEGSQGTVYRIDQTRCIKIFKKKRYFQRELKTLQRGQKSPFFPQIHQWGNNFIIREYVRGTPLSEYLILNQLTVKITAQIITLLKDLQELGFKRLDIRLPHIFITPSRQLKIIDPTNMMNHQRKVPEKMLAGLERLGQKNRFLRFVQELDSELYNLWHQYLKD